MKLIIDIPKKEYQYIINEGFLERTHGKMCYKAILKSIPLDKIRNEIEKELELENADIQSEYSQGGYDVLKRIINTNIFRCEEVKENAKASKYDALDKIREEIKQMQTYDQFTGENYSAYEFKSDVLDIIDNYR